MPEVEGYVSMRDDEADALADALSPDDTENIHTEAKGDELKIEFEYDDVSTAINSLDDALSCLGTAKEVQECI